jgi:AAA domain
VPHPPASPGKDSPNTVCIIKPSSEILVTAVPSDDSHARAPQVSQPAAEAVYRANPLPGRERECRCRVGGSHMVNLHYENFPDVNYPVDGLIKRVNYSIGEYLKYNTIARELQWAPTRLEKVRWKPASKELLSQINGSSAAGPSQGIWVEIEEVGEREDVDVIDDFANSSFVIDAPQSWARKIKVNDSDANRGLLLLGREPEVKSAPNGEVAEPLLYLPPDDYALYQQEVALLKLRDRPEPHHRGIIRLMEDSSRIKWPPVDVKETERWEFLKDGSVEGTDEQRRFAGIALGTQDFAILEGPPGSGKTMTICELIIQEIRQGHRIMLCASTHVAVDNVLESLQERGVTSKDVLAVRIGDERRISESVRDFQLGVRAKKEARDLIERLSGLGSRTPAQQYLLDALQASPDKSEGIISRIILDSANLVCGTTVGILQHPDIKAQRMSKKGDNGRRSHAEEPVVRPFDCLIVDEASKTTLQEFLVPALFARKWVLVGDVKQLSPYIEPTQIEDNLRGMLEGEDDATVCVDVFQSWSGSKFATQGIVILDPPEPKKYIQQAEKLGLNPLDLTQPGAVVSPLEVLGSHVILCSTKMFPLIKQLIPQDAVIHPAGAMTPEIRRRHDYWLRRNPWGASDAPREDRLSEWAYSVAWRLGRSFELRHNPDEAQRYDEAVRSLLPQWYGEDALNLVMPEIETIKRIALPSALELMQKGFGRRTGSITGSSLTDGMDASALTQRHVRLSYQHRMHPDISLFPRESVYDSASLKDTRDITRDRSWSYSRFKTRAGWIQSVGGRSDARNRNLVETDIVQQELQTFLSWAAVNRKRSGDSHSTTWEVAVLTFYRGQESLLRARLQRMFGNRFRTEFKTSDGATRIRLCTVDRFQGHEADLVIVSFARSRGIGFLDSPNRLNVAITRARYQLLLVGSQRMFAGQRRDNLLKKLATDVPTLRVAWEARR